MGWQEEQDDIASLRSYRAKAYAREKTQRHVSDLALWCCDPSWARAEPYAGTHNQPPVSGEIEWR